MPKQIVIAEHQRIAAVFAEEQIQELIVAKGTHQVSDIYYGVVENVLPGIDAAFINIGDNQRNGFIHVSDLGPLRLRRTAGAITELLSPQQKVLVQVMKEPTGNKGPRLTGNISLPGRYLVLMPSDRGVNLSRRIQSEAERNRLRALAVLIKPAGMGLVMRTEAEGVPEEAIMEDLDNLQRQWETILQEANTAKAPALLNRDDDFVQRVLRDSFSSEVNRIVVDSAGGLKRVKQHLMSWSSGKLPRVLVEHHRERTPILEFFRVNAAIREALKPRVDLPAGGYIVIQPTEALTVIDVNSGSFTRSATARETVLWTNCEAAVEIARQLRLRNLGGVIIVDFIDMDSHRDKQQLLEHFIKALRADKARPQVSQLSELGLVELTRKRQGQNLYELFGRPCSACGGLGYMAHLPSEGDSHDLPDLDLESEDDNSPLRQRLSLGESPEPEEANSRRPQRSRSPQPTLRNGDRGRKTIADLGPSPWDSLETDPTPETEEPELLNHPSYQERGKVSNNRRRRTRIKGSEVTKGSLSNDRPGLSPSLNSTSEPLASLSAPEVNTPAEKTDRQRGKRPPETLAQEATPRSREVVTVEMTPEEQEVYSWMGISPLLLSSQEVKNPRLATTTVILPGEAAPEPAFAPGGTPTMDLPLTAAEEPLELAMVAPEADLTVEAVELAEPAPQPPARGRRRRRSHIPSSLEEV